MTSSCWVLTDGRVGIENQALGLAEALGYDPQIHRVSAKNPWNIFAPHWGKSVSFSPPYPDFVIACGRQSILPALSLKKNHQSRVIYIQNPQIPCHYFDAVVCPEHDRVNGKNVISMIGSPHRITPERLEIVKNQWCFGYLPKPRIGILFGGNSRSYCFPRNIAEQIMDQIESMSIQGSLLITPSRRTPVEVVQYIQKRVSRQSNIYFWNQEGENPYMAILAWSDALILTCDSVNMSCEASVTKAPLYWIRLPGGNSKFSRFQKSMTDQGRIQWITDTHTLRITPQRPFNALPDVVSALRERGF